MIEPAARK